MKTAGASIPAENVPGRFFVDERCIGCGLCPEIAPENFRSDLEEGYRWVGKQPASKAEERLCVDAMEICPVNAIRSDGEGRTPPSDGPGSRHRGPLNNIPTAPGRRSPGGKS